MSDWKRMTEEISVTIELTEDSSKELLRILEEQDAEFINEILEGKRDLTIRGSDGRSVELTPKALEKKEVSEDAISREWAINKQKEMIDLYTPHKTVEGRGQVYWQIEERKLVAKELEQAPSVVPKRSCYRCGLREDCEDSTERKPKEGAKMKG